MSPRSFPRPIEDMQPSATEQCTFCLEKPSGPAGHAGLALHAHRISPSVRTHVRLTCAFCGTRWARRRSSATVFEWCRLAD
jgi:hypothetical protein